MKKTKKKQPSIKEALRYVENARELLRERGQLDEEGFMYEDDKYVRAAGNYLWLGVLMALDTVFHVRKDRRTRVDLNAYEDAVAKRDRKLLSWVSDGYDVMHLSMTYDGVSVKKICDSGFDIAEKIIDRCSTMV